MGKVGSSSLAKSLRKSINDYEIYQIHFLTKEFIERVNKQYREASKVRNQVIIETHFLASKYLAKIISQKSTCKKFKVISIVRDPIARNISSFFQAFPIYFADEYVTMQNTSLTNNDKIKLLIELFIKKFDRHNVPLEWFDIHMQPVFNIDIYAQSFTKSLGYKIYHADNIDLLILRLEDLNKNIETAMQAFLGIKNFKLENANISSGKDYSNDYSLFKNQLKLPQSYISDMYDSKYMKYFYTDSEINAFTSKWAK